MARRVADVVDGPVRVLEVACGTGISTRHLANALPAGLEIFGHHLNEGDAGACPRGEWFTFWRYLYSNQRARRPLPE